MKRETKKNKSEVMTGTRVRSRISGGQKRNRKINKKADEIDAWMLRSAQKNRTEKKRAGQTEGKVSREEKIRDKWGGGRAAG